MGKKENRADAGKSKRRTLVARFALAGATVGLFAGIYEAALLYFTPRVPTLLEPDIAYPIWFLAPLVSTVFFALLGAVLGVAAAAGKRTHPWRTTILAAAGLGIAGAYLALAADISHVWVGNKLAGRSLAAPSVWLIGVFAYALVPLSVLHRRTGHFLDPETPQPYRRWVKILVAGLVVCLSGLAWFAIRRSPAHVAAAHRPLKPDSLPNIVLIVLDTVRADHLSAYGYSRRTTPNIDRLAREGMLFENAVSPSSWTLPSIAALLTGLLPHQHGANWSIPLGLGTLTLPEVLEAQGYETAGFNANPSYGLAGWGIGQGFEVYVDDSSSLRHNLSATVVGRLLVNPLYEWLYHANAFDRRSAAQVNRDVFGWFRHRSGRPYFLLINYYDAHYPYFAPPPYVQRFGKIPESAIRRAENFEFRGHVPVPLAREQPLVVAAYDNCLAYLDNQVGELLQYLARSPEWPNTIVIITADHGEAFGEHNAYGHGINLYREVLHVPLILHGPGIPVGRRITSMVRYRDVFPTVLDLALRQTASVGVSSLRRFWMPHFRTELSDDIATSELIPSISITTSEWHYIYSASGQSELYYLPKDPEEKINLVEIPRLQRIAEALHGRLINRVMLSAGPWRGTDYLLSIKWQGPSSSNTAAFRLGLQPKWLPPEGWGVPANMHPSASEPRRPQPGEKDLINSLPYH